MHAQNIHENLSGDPTEMMITWVTLAESVKSVVEYGERYKLPLNMKTLVLLPSTKLVAGRSGSFICIESSSKD